MQTQTIKLLTPVMVGGQQASPKDKNNGIYTVILSEARNLIARKRAIKFDGKVEDQGDANTKTAPVELETLKNIALELGVKHNPNISAPTLEKKLKGELEKMAEEIGLTIAQDTNILDAYEQYKAKKDEKDGQDDNNKITIDELKEIAEAADIEIDENTADDELKELVESELKQYANELGLELQEDDNAITLWAKIQEKLTKKDNK